MTLRKKLERGAVYAAGLIFAALLVKEWFPSAQLTP